MNFPRSVCFTLERLEQNGYSAYLVGGCVRDYIMGNVPNDYDITTNANPDEIIKCFPDIKTLDIGIKHGTVTLVFEDMNIEVTTYRVDGEYKDSRHPESVTFTDRIEDDLARRDFTMNAIAYSPKRGFVDPFDGRGDIEKKRIVCVGDADVRFTEDALRIMRALRFSSRLGFEIDEDTSSAIHEKKELLLNIAMERINSEFLGLICKKNCADVIRKYRDVFKCIIPHLSDIDYSALQRSCDMDTIVSLCVFFNGLPDADLLQRELKRLKFDNITIKSVLSVRVLLDDYIGKCRDADVMRAVSKIGEDNACNLYRVLYCLTGESAYFDAVGKIRVFSDNGVCMTLRQLDVKGNEIIEKYKINPSDTGRILSCILDDVIDGIIPNIKAALLERAANYI